jgi:hypothetical protein
MSVDAPELRWARGGCCNMADRVEPSAELAKKTMLFSSKTVRSEEALYSDTASTMEGVVEAGNVFVGGQKWQSEDFSPVRDVCAPFSLFVRFSRGRKPQ